MGARRNYIVATFAVASLLASGCYCPMLSGRYGDAGCFPGGCPNLPPPEAGPGPPAPACSPTAQGGCCLGKHCGTRWLFGNSAPTPSRQHDDYVSPQPRFHPVPTHPVFEPQFDYPPPFSLTVPAKSHAR